MREFSERKIKGNFHLKRICFSFLHTQSLDGWSLGVFILKLKNYSLPKSCFTRNIFFYKLNFFWPKKKNRKETFPSPKTERRRKTKFSLRNFSAGYDELFMCYVNYCSFWILRKLFFGSIVSQFLAVTFLQIFNFLSCFFLLCVELKT